MRSENGHTFSRGNRRLERSRSNHGRDGRKPASDDQGHTNLMGARRLIGGCKQQSSVVDSSTHIRNDIGVQGNPTVAGSMLVEGDTIRESISSAPASAGLDPTYLNGKDLSPGVVKPKEFAGPGEEKSVSAGALIVMNSGEASRGRGCAKARFPNGSAHQVAPSARIKSLRFTVLLHLSYKPHRGRLYAGGDENWEQCGLARGPNQGHAGSIGDFKERTGEK